MGWREQDAGPLDWYTSWVHGTDLESSKNNTGLYPGTWWIYQILVTLNDFVSPTLCYFTTWEFFDNRMITLLSRYDCIIFHCWAIVIILKNWHKFCCYGCWKPIDNSETIYHRKYIFLKHNNNQQNVCILSGWLQINGGNCIIWYVCSEILVEWLY